MKYDNNYHFAGPKAILYKVPLDFLGLHVSKAADGYCYVDEWNNPGQVKDIGFEWKKATDNEWHTVSCVDETQNKENGDITFDSLTKDVLTGNVMYTSYYMRDSRMTECRRIMPIYVVIKGLEPQTDYNIRMYVQTGGTRTTYHNSITATTTSPNATAWRCTGITGGNEAQRNILSASIDTAIEIFTSITSLPPLGNLQTGIGSTFAATIQSLEGACANSGMNFRPTNSCLDLATVMHEMAHNEVGLTQLTNENKDRVMKFMEFATHAEGALWKWQGAHSYPFIWPNESNIVKQYIIAASCQVNHGQS